MKITKLEMGITPVFFDVALNNSIMRGSARSRCGRLVPVMGLDNTWIHKSRHLSGWSCVVGGVNVVFVV